MEKMLFSGIKTIDMLENILNLVQQFAGDSIINNPAIPNEKNHEAIAVASESITGGLSGLLSQGGMKEVLRMFSGQDSGSNNQGVTQQISNGLTQNLMDKLGLDNNAAGSIAGSLIPQVLKNLVQRTNDPNDSSFDIQGLFNSLSGGRTSGVNLQDMLSRVKSGALDLDGDGDTDLQDLLLLFNKTGNGSGGLLNKIKGLFGR